MSDGIFFETATGLELLAETPYEKEAVLQTALEKYPEVIAGISTTGDSQGQLALIKREIGVPGEQEGSSVWSLDHLFVDRDAQPIFVEVKRSTDTRIRREVVGQMLDYAANGSKYWPAGHLRESFESRIQSEFGGELDASAWLQQHLGVEDADEYWQRADENLRYGHVRLVFVADKLPTELVRIIEFLNEQMSQTEVLAVEVKQFKGEGLTTLVPRLIGQTSLAEQRKRPGDRGRPFGEFNEERFFSTLSRNVSPAGVAVARRILEWSRERGLRIWGGADSFFPMFDLGGQGFHFLAVKNGGRVQFQFQWMRKPPYRELEEREALRQALNKIPGIQIPKDRLSGKPSVSLESFADPVKAEALLQVFQAFISDIQKHHAKSG